MKLKTAIFYRLRYQGISLSVFFVFFFLFACAMPILGVLMSKPGETVVSDMTVAGFVYSVIIAFIGSHIDFKWFMQNGMSRKNIFLANILTSFFWPLVTVLVFYLFKGIFAGNLVPSFHLDFMGISLYKLNNFYQFWLLSLLFFLANALGLFLGIFNDRFNYMTKLVTGLTVVSVGTLFMLSIQIFGESFREKCVKVFYQLVGYQKGVFNSLNLVFTLVIVSVVLLGFSFVMNQTRELKKD